MIALAPALSPSLLRWIEQGGVRPPIDASLLQQGPALVAGLAASPSSWGAPQRRRLWLVASAGHLDLLLAALEGHLAGEGLPPLLDQLERAELPAGWEDELWMGALTLALAPTHPLATWRADQAPRLLALAQRLVDDTSQPIPLGLRLDRLFQHSSGPALAPLIDALMESPLAPWLGAPALRHAGDRARAWRWALEHPDPGVALACASSEADWRAAALRCLQRPAAWHQGRQLTAVLARYGDPPAPLTELPGWSAAERALLETSRCP